MVQHLQSKPEGIWLLSDLLKSLVNCWHYQSDPNNKNQNLWIDSTINFKKFFNMLVELEVVMNDEQQKEKKKTHYFEPIYRISRYRSFSFSKFEGGVEIKMSRTMFDAERTQVLRAEKPLCMLYVLMQIELVFVTHVMLGWVVVVVFFRDYYQEKN